MVLEVTGMIRTITRLYSISNSKKITGNFILDAHLRTVTIFTLIIKYLSVILAVLPGAT